jgi:hypothetical protein
MARRIASSPETAGEAPQGGAHKVTSEYSHMTKFIVQQLIVIIQV